MLALPALRGRKTPAERFPAALETYTLEALMRDGKALQVATSHYLGQNFARAYDVRFTDANGDEQLAWATSWGASTRLMGALVMAHGDDRGLRLPPGVAPHQVVIVPVAAGDDGRPAEAASRLPRSCARRRARARRRPHRPARRGQVARVGAKGVPVRIDVGARELDAGALPVTRRDRLTREAVTRDGIAVRTGELLGEIQRTLHDEAAARTEAATLRDADSYGDFANHLAAGSGFAVAPWCGDPVCEARVKEDTSATIRCLPLEREDPGAPCIVCGRPAAELATFAQSDLTMAKLIYAAICSLDGYVNDVDGRFGWAAPDEEVHADVNEHERAVGTYLYGRRLYETMAVWQTFGLDPAESAVVRDFGELWRAADKIVYSRTLDAVSTPRTRLEPVFDAAAVRALKEAAERPLSVGGAGLAAEALRAGLVDECNLYVVPELVGGGTPALPRGIRRSLELVAERRFANGTVALRYRMR